jgi:hypothetical protein
VVLHNVVLLQEGVTGKGVLLTFDDGSVRWVPRSRIAPLDLPDAFKVGWRGSVEIPDWLVKTFIAREQTTCPHCGGGLNREVPAGWNRQPNGRGAGDE